MKIEHNNTKIAYYLKQLFQSPFYVPRDMGAYDEHQWRQAKEIFREMQSINEDTILSNGNETWENIHLKPYGLRTDNIHIESDGTFIITLTAKSKV